MNRFFLLIVQLAFLIVSCTPKEQKQINVIELSITDLETALQTRDCTCVQVISIYLDRIDSLDQSSGVNSMVVLNEKALDQARTLDEEFKETGKLRKLHCLPLIVKDNYKTEGLQTTGGSIALKGYLPTTDAWQVQKLKEAGAIVLGKSNMAEWAFSAKVTISSIAGETRNPYNIAHTTAGSSGGTAAAVAANFGLAGLGSDTGNSIRGPSSHNALVGFRTTLGLISREGIIPLANRNDVGGPMTKTVTDATQMLEVLVGVDENDPMTKYSEGNFKTDYQQYLQKDGLKAARIGVLRVLSDRDHDDQVNALFEQALANMQKVGATLIEVKHINNFDSLSANQWCPMFQNDLNEFLANEGDLVPVKNLEEVITFGGYSDYIEGTLNYFLEHPKPFEEGRVCGDPYTDPNRIKYREAIRNVMDSLQLDALVYPSWNFPPAKIGDFEGYKGDNSQIIAPHTGQPAFTVPMGNTYDNLAAGLQFLGRMYDEPTLIKLTYAYEQATHHRKPPKGFE
jgi:amidase